ncbi:MAG TPA: pyrroloquinoline quinone biosynthesis peptide chaperone PqqD [Granulicella sp.]
MTNESTPRIAPGCRLHPTEEVLLIPEGALELAGPAREILELTDGQRTVAAIITELSAQYPDADAAEIGADVLEMLNGMEERGVVRA